MKGNSLVRLLPLVITCFLQLMAIVQAQRDTDPCRLFGNGTKLRHPEDCSQEIVCNNFESTAGIKCSGSKPFYNKDTHNCQYHLSDHSTCDINCTNMTAKFVADPKSCYGYYYCQDEKLALYGHCPDAMHFSQTLQSCVYTYQSTCAFHKLNFCAIVKVGIKFKDETHCGRYNTCAQNIKTKVIELKNEYCGANARYFNAIKGACQAAPIEGCRPVPKDVCIVNKQIKKNYFVSDGGTCRGSFYCANVGNFADPKPQWNQCPDNKFFSQKMQKCLDPKEVVCQKDRCEGSTRTFVTSSEKGCRNYLRCENGIKVGQGTCGNDFFDEERGACTPNIVTYPACYYK